VQLGRHHNDDATADDNHHATADDNDDAPTDDNDHASADDNDECRHIAGRGLVRRSPGRVDGATADRVEPEPDAGHDTQSRHAGRRDDACLPPVIRVRLLRGS